MSVNNSAANRGIDPSVATGLAPEATESDVVKGFYTVARFAAQNDHHVGFYKTWTKAINFLIGDHWKTKWDGTSMSWGAERDIPPWHQQPVTNLTFAVYRTALAKLTKQKPSLEVVPPSGDSEDQEAGELSEALLTYLWRSLKKPAKMPVALGWMLVTGMAFGRVGWDPQAGASKPRTIPIPRPRQSLGAPDPDEMTEGDDTGAASPVAGAMSPNGAGGAAGAAGAPGAPGAPSAAPGDGDNETTADGAGDDLLDMEDVEVACDEDGEPYMKNGEIDWDREPDIEPTGEICFDIISPLCVRLNPEATSINDADEMYVGTLWPKKKAAEHFGIDERLLGNADESAETQALYDDLMSASAAGFPRSWSDQASVWGVSQQNAIGDRILVIEYYANKSAKYPKGRHWITAGHKKVWPPTGPATGASDSQSVAATPTDASEKPDTDAPANAGMNDADNDPDDFVNGEAPLPFGFWPPLVPMLDTPIPGQPTALGMIPQVVPLNEQLNVLDSKIAEKHTMDSMGGIWFASTEDKGLVITSEPAQVIFSKAMTRRGQAFAPFQAQMHPLPEPVYREREVMSAKIQAVSGLSALDMSQPPQGVTAGRAFLVMQETSDSVLMPTLFSMEAFLEECGNRELLIAQQKYSEDRTIAIKGDDGKWLYRSFRGADLRSGHDVRVQVGSSFPWSKAAQWDTKLSVVEALPGLVVDAQTGKVDKVALAKILDSGAPGLGAFESEQDPDLVEIEREHAMFEAFDPFAPDGSHQVPQLAFWQNHAIHLEEHYRFMKKSFARFSRWSPDAQQAFKDHMRLTAIAVDDVATRMMGAPAQAPPGGPGAPGAPGAPGGPAAAPPGAPAGPPPGPAGPATGAASPPSQMQLTPGDRAAATPG